MSNTFLQNRKAAKSSSEIISLEECRKCVEKYELSEERLEAIRDTMIGIVNGVLNEYLEAFE